MFDELCGPTQAGVPEWSKGAHSRCAAKCFVGSNPTSGTTDSISTKYCIYKRLESITVWVRRNYACYFS